MAQYKCGGCGFIYDEALGLPDQDIAPGTPWEDIPTTWTCPQLLDNADKLDCEDKPAELVPCGTHKSHFSRLEENKFKQWICVICGYIYDEQNGHPEEGIDPGTRWEDVPNDWACPDCGASKDDFEMVEIN